MAILDAAISAGSLATAESAWPWVRDLGIGIRLPKQVVVTNIFSRVLRIKEIKTKASEKEAAIARAKADMSWPLTSTIGYREYVYYSGHITLAFAVADEYSAQLAAWLAQISYLGKRGGFVQMLAPAQVVDDVSELVLLTSEADSFPIDGLIQQLDDCDPKMKFAEANIYDGKKPRRIVRHIVIPYRLARSSRSYSLYEAI
jgi:hypothetical protein